MKCVLSKFVAALGASMLLLAPMTASAQSDGSAEASLFTTGYLSSYLGVYSTYIGIPITIYLIQLISNQRANYCYI